MVTWTEKAEADYRKKWPGRPCKRIAGEEAKYEGQRLIPGSSVCQAYAMRGWVQQNGMNVTIEPQKTCHYKNMTGRMGMSFEEQRQRWVKMQRCIKDNPDIDLKGLTENLGLKDPQAIRIFIKKHGLALSERWGKLPKLNSRIFHRGIWNEVVER